MVQQDTTARVVCCANPTPLLRSLSQTQKTLLQLPELPTDKKGGFLDLWERRNQRLDIILGHLPTCLLQLYGGV